MKKLAYALAAAAAIAVAAPTVASAQGFGVYVGGDRGYYGDRYDGPRARFYTHDRGWHRGWYHRDMDRDRDVVIRRYWRD
jgi:opacity protein-like surface antigen